MPKQLLIIFVKNIVLGKVKTRLAKTIGNQKAFNIYKELVSITEQATKNIPIEKHIYFSDEIINSKWVNDDKFVQNGNNIGHRMSNAFKASFDQGYEQIILVGSDLPDITSDIILDGFKALNQNKIVFGPAEDGGYYLVGMNTYTPTLFQNKPWSQSNLLETTLQQLKDYTLLTELNDIDTIDDLKKSSLNSQLNI